jgi:hypothetical protein
MPAKRADKKPDISIFLIIGVDRQCSNRWPTKKTRKYMAAPINAQVLISAFLDRSATVSMMPFVSAKSRAM